MLYLFDFLSYSLLNDRTVVRIANMLSLYLLPIIKLFNFWFYVLMAQNFCYFNLILTITLVINWIQYIFRNYCFHCICQFSFYFFWKNFIFDNFLRFAYHNIDWMRTLTSPYFYLFLYLYYFIFLIYWIFHV